MRRRFRSAAASAPRDHAARAVRTAHCQIEAVKGLRGHGYSWAEIGARLGISRNTVVTHMVNALAAIEREMAADK